MSRDDAFAGYRQALQAWREARQPGRTFAAELETEAELVRASRALQDAGGDPVAEILSDLEPLGDS